MKPQIFALVAGLAALVGCASGPDFKTYSSTLPSQKSTEARIWFYRPQVLFGTALEPRVYLNKVSVGQARVGGCFYVDVSPGSYEIQCGDSRIDKAFVAAKANEVRYFRLTGVASALTGVWSSRVIPEEANEVEASKELQRCNFIGEKRMKENSGFTLKTATQ